MKVGTSTITLPAGSFDHHGFRYSYEGTVDGATVTAQFEDLGSDRFDFVFTAQSVDLTDTANPVAIGLRIGNDFADTTARLPGWLGNRPAIVRPD